MLHMVHISAFCSVVQMTKTQPCFWERKKRIFTERTKKDIQVGLQYIILYFIYLSYDNKCC